MLSSQLLRNRMGINLQRSLLIAILTGNAKVGSRCDYVEYALSIMLSSQLLRNKMGMNLQRSLLIAILTGNAKLGSSMKYKVNKPRVFDEI